MNIVCIGGGPAGLYFALLMKQQNPAHGVTVVERNKPYDTFGWGVVFSDATMDNMRLHDAVTAQEIEQSFNHWDDIELEFKGEVIRSGGHGFVGIGRKKLLNILQARCEALDVKLVFETDVKSDLDYPDADLIIASDGIFSTIRSRYEAVFKPEIVVRPNKYIWLGTNKLYDAFTFLFEKTEHGWFQAHIYKFDENTTTFIVECPEHVWLAHGLDKADQAASIAFCEQLFANNLQGAKLMTNARHLRGSAWLSFQQVKCAQWSHFNGKSHVVLMGDAVHTAHFAIGSGTKLALEDAIELSNQFKALGQSSNDISEHIPEVLKTYQALRNVDVLRLQNAAWNAMEWFEVCGLRYCDRMEPQQFMYSMLTRSQRISHENLRLRDANWLGSYEDWFAKRNAAQLKLPVPTTVLPPMFTPWRVRSLDLKNRVVVSPMATYNAVDGMAQDFHLVHLGARALGGAALVMLEMTSPTPEGRITPACLGLWNDAQMQSLKRIVDFAHQQSSAKMGLQLGHSGAKGSTQVGWEQTDEPLPRGNWELMAASDLAYGAQNQVPHAMTHADMAELKAEFVAATKRAVTAGFDWLELHCAHGYLLSSFLTPLMNKRSDEYGGSIENRCRYPVEVFTAMRAVWPAHLPMSVRISAHDWMPGGNTGDDAVAIAKAFKDVGCDVIDVSSGQTSRDAKPVYGRMYQTPFADRIRNEVDIQTIAVGAITTADQVNSIIAAGRADLCAIARPHLADPAFTLHAAAQAQVMVDWPKPYWSGRDQAMREAAKTQVMPTAKV